MISLHKESMPVSECVNCLGFKSSQSLQGIFGVSSAKVGAAGLQHPLIILEACIAGWVEIPYRKGSKYLTIRYLPKTIMAIPNREGFNTLSFGTLDPEGCYEGLPNSCLTSGKLGRHAPRALHRKLHRGRLMAA